jgi:hypothetical protein
MKFGSEIIFIFSPSAQMNAEFRLNISSPAQRTNLGTWMIFAGQFLSLDHPKMLNAS